METKPILDGTSVLRHDAYDVDAWDRALDLNQRLQSSVKAGAERMPTASDLARDIYMSLYKQVPQVNPMAPLKPSHVPHQSIMEQAMGTGEWNELRGHGTPGDVLLSSIAAAGMAQDILSALPEEAQRQIQDAKQAEDRIRALQAYAEALKDLQADEPDADKQADMQGKIDRATAQADKISAGMGDGALSDAAADAARQAFRASAKAAGQRADAASNAMEVFGHGYGNQAGDPNRKMSDADVKAALDLQQNLTANPNLARIAELAGRNIRLALTTEIQRLDHEPEEIVGVEEGRDLGQVVPSELLMLTDPDAALIFAHRFAQSSLQQYRLDATAPKHRGPIIVAVDQSISMSGSRIIWAQAICQAIIAKAAAQQRAVKVMAFSGPGALRCWDLDSTSDDPDKAITTNRLIEIAMHNWGGGTDYEGWMVQANVAVREAAYDKADTILLSDGEAPLNGAVTAEFNRLRAERGMRCYTVVIGPEISPDFLSHFCDAHVYLTDLANDKEAVDLVFHA